MRHSRLFAFGSNGSGQLGVGHCEDLSSPSHVLVDDDEPIEQIASGGNHTLFLFGNGSVAACGNNEQHQCGLRQEQIGSHTVTVPTKVHLNSKEDGTAISVRRVAVTWTTSIFVSSAHQIYSVGKGLNGELGLGPGLTSAIQATAMPAFPPPGDKIVQISSSMAHAIVVLSSGDVYGWGKGRSGQLGEPPGDVWSPRRLSVPFRASDATCGKDFTCIVGREGDILLLGLNKRDRFRVQANVPRSIVSTQKIVSSWGSIYVLGLDEQNPPIGRDRPLISWGRNDHGQLPPSQLPPIQNIAAGSEHCLALTNDQRVLAWGWGEHGNCGRPIDDSGDVKGRFNVISRADPAIAVFAGCATSFFVTSTTLLDATAGNRSEAIAQSNNPWS